MPDLGAQIARVEALVDEGSQESLTLAALRCRLAIEQVCYERLRVAHDYISHDDLKRWQPRDVVSTLIQDVDPHVASDYTMSISTRPVRSGRELNRADYEAEDYVEIGRQVGFDAKLLGKLWNALGNFLHVRPPRTTGDNVSLFGQAESIERKVREVLVELRRLQQGTLVASGVGETVRFECNCGVENKRRAALLANGQTISCIKPDCSEKWVVEIEGDEIGFRRRSMDVTCQACGEIAHFAEQDLLGLKRNQTMSFTCEPCGTDNYLMWKLMQMRPSD